MDKEPNPEANSKKENEQSLVDLQKLLELEQKRSNDCLTRLQYMQADFENLQKRCDRQIAQVSQYSTERLVIQLLEVVDELELAVKNAENTKTAEALVEGVQMTLKRLRKVLEQEGVTPIESVNKPFDPTKHNAIAAEERDDIEGDCVVVEEVRKGYIMKDKVIRPSIVKVATKKSQSQNKEQTQNESS